MQADQNNLGVAVMEVFVRKDSEGNWQRQACVASPSGGPQQPAENMPFASGAFSLSTPFQQVFSKCNALVASLQLV